MKNEEKRHEFVLMQGVVSSNFGNRFFTTFDPTKDQTKSANGEVWYEIIGYADTVEEAQMKLYGRTYK